MPLLTTLTHEDSVERKIEIVLYVLMDEVEHPNT